MRALSIGFAIVLFWSQGAVGESKSRARGRQRAKVSASKLRPFELVKYRRLFLALTPETGYGDATHENSLAYLADCGLTSFEADILIALAADYQVRSTDLLGGARDQTERRRREAPQWLRDWFQNRQLLKSLVTFLPDYIGPLGATKVREQCLDGANAFLREQRRHRARTHQSSTAAGGETSGLDLSMPAELPEPSCGDLGGDYCSPMPSCPDGYDYIEQTWDCEACCVTSDPGPSCGEAGGDFCSQSGSCPDGYGSLGQTFDCNPCCKSEPAPPPPGPSCGEIGGDYCSQSGSCPEGYSSLGQTSDCNPCCELEPEPPPEPSCGELGGDHCSQTGSCPDGYSSLGSTYDCNPCCKSESAPPPPPPTPTCGEMGGDTCSQTGSCPEGTTWLGVSSDCDPCCKSIPEPPPPQGPLCIDLGGEYCSQSGVCPEGFISLGQSADCNPCCDPDPDYIPPERSCGELGGDYCGEGGFCPEGYEPLGFTENCKPCCKSLHPTCGELGGDYCSDSGWCPWAHESLGQTWDCNACCRSFSPPPPGSTCEEIGGDYCSQNRFCPQDYESLGATEDCNPCCKSPPLAGPSCDELGGFYCSGGPFCPDGYVSLGPTYECTQCCGFPSPTPPPPPAPSNLFCSELGGEYCGEGGSCPEGYESIGETDDCTPCCVLQSPPPLETEAGEACRLAGYALASDETSYKGHFIMIAVVNEHFRYWGIAEGHDGRANLLQYPGHEAPTICNIDRGTCTGIDGGCGVPDALTVCSGKHGEPACSYGQYCDGSWTSVGYQVSPVYTAPSESAELSFNPYQPMHERSISRAVSYTPVDCDCLDYREGRQGFYQAVSLNGEFRREESAFQTIAQGVSNVGRIVATAPPYVRVVVRVSYVCAGRDGRIMGTVPIRSQVEQP